MKLTFEVHTTTSRPIYLSIEDDILLKDLHDQLLYDIDHYTILCREDILDIFVTGENKEILSIPNDTTYVRDFVNNNYKFFQNTSFNNKFHKIYVIDKMYITRTNSGLETPIYSEIKPQKKNNSWKDLLIMTKNLIYL
jgi:hypothetical protein